MSMVINGSYRHYQTDYAEQLKADQALERAEKAEETEKGRNEEKAADKIPVLHDEYISSEKSGTKPTGLYWLGQDENGNRKVFYDGKEQPKAESDNAGKDDGQPKVKSDNPEKPAETCTGNTDKVDREIEKLKEKKKQLEQQIQSASGDEAKVRELEKELAQVENELSQKDNDTYRRQHSSFSE